MEGLGEALIIMENNLTNQTMQESNVNQQPMSYGDILRETQQEEFPLLSEVTRGIVEGPITLMSSIYDEDGVVVPCPNRCGGRCRR